jgi:hypothetical protein
MRQPISILVLAIAAGCLPALVRADDASRQVVGRELGSALGWRLGPEAVEEACRPVDPDGVGARQKSLKAWLEKNAALINEVDARVAEVVPLAFPSPKNVDAVTAVRAQVRKIVLEPLFAGRTAEQTAAICKAEADPANPRWKSNGMPEVRQALAALYDWQIQSTPK